MVGRTGSGKSTLLMSVLRILEPSRGTIDLDGTDIKSISLDNLRSSMSIILQDHYLFAGSVRDNIDPAHEYMDSQIIDALKTTEAARNLESAKAALKQAEEEAAAKKNLYTVLGVLAARSWGHPRRHSGDSLAL